MCALPDGVMDGKVVIRCEGALRLRLVVGRLGTALLGAVPGDLLAIAGAVDVDADGSHGEAVEDGGGDGSVAEVAAPGAQLDVGGDGRRSVGVPAVDEVEERVRRGGLVVALLDLAEADVVDDQEFGCGPPLEAARVGAVGEAGVEVIEQVDAAGVADAELAFTRLDAEGLQDVALARAALAGEEQVVGAVDEVEAGELADERLVEARLEGPVEGLEGLALDEAGELDAALDAALALVLRLLAEDTLEERARGRLFLGRPDQVIVEVFERAGQA